MPELQHAGHLVASTASTRGTERAPAAIRLTGATTGHATVAAVARSREVSLQDERTDETVDTRCPQMVETFKVNVE